MFRNGEWPTLLGLPNGSSRSGEAVETARGHGVWKVGCDLVSKLSMVYQDGRHSMAAPDYTNLGFLCLL
jgi:hypothetical protein